MPYWERDPYTNGVDYDEDLDPGDIDEVTVIAARTFLEHAVGHKYNWDSPHMARTPIRFAKMIREMTSDDTPFQFTTFPNNQKSDEMVIVRNIPFTAMCAHHVVPFTGRAHVAYIPTNTLVGLSKIARAVTWWSKGLWVQEELTTAIASFLEENLTCEDQGPLGVAVVMEAIHQCMTLRGVKSEGSETITSCMRGVFLDNERHARQEFLSLITKGN